MGFLSVVCDTVCLYKIEPQIMKTLTDGIHIDSLYNVVTQTSVSRMHAHIHKPYILQYFD